MLNRTAMASGDVVISELDYDRLTHLVESGRYRSTQPMPVGALKRELDRGQVVAPASVPGDLITMHSRVRVRDIARRQMEDYTLVYPEEVAMEAGKVSVLSPIGRALLGARVGQVVEFAAPGGTRRLKVLRILYQPEAAGDHHL